MYIKLYIECMEGNSVQGGFCSVQVVICCGQGFVCTVLGGVCSVQGVMSIWQIFVCSVQGVVCSVQGVMGSVHDVLVVCKQGL